MFDRKTCIGTAIACTLALAGGAQAQTVEQVMHGLDNPRGIAFAPNGTLYVTEAGVGGPPNIPHANNCMLNANTNEYRCYGPTGAISRFGKGGQERVVSGLPSHAVYNHANQAAFPNGSSAAGPNDISFLGTGSAFVTLGLGGDEAFQDALGTGAPLFGTMLQIPASGRWRVVADVFAHEVAQNPAGGPIDSNPYGVLAEPGVRYVADAGANALLAVWASGHVETVAVFPKVPWTLPPIPGLPPFPNPTDPVPTGVARGPDGALYVGLLTGVPFAPGAASVMRVVPGEAPTVHVGGFKAITDIAFDDDGNLYVLEHSTGGPFFSANSGKLTRVSPPPALTKTQVIAGLNRPTSVAIGPDGAIYVANNGVVPGQGEVLKITP